LVAFHQESYLRLFKQRRFYFWQALEMGGLQIGMKNMCKIHPYQRKIK